MKITKTQIKKWLAGFVMVFGTAGLIVIPQISEHGKMKVVFFNVGQGDAALVRTAEGEDILIDGGPDSKILEELGRNLPFFDRKIELVILTHPHADHIFGLIEVLKRYEVGKVLTTNAKNSTDFFEEWERILKDKNIQIEIANRGDKFQFDNVKIEVLWPANENIEKDEKKLNDNSIVFNLKFSEHEILFTGDVTCEAEEEILKLGDVWKSDDLGFEILKVPHHGSKTSSCNNFLETLKPDAAIISVGKNNKYNLPSLRTVKRLENHAQQLWRTDENGDIAFVCDEKECKSKIAN